MMKRPNIDPKDILEFMGNHGRSLVFYEKLGEAFEWRKWMHAIPCIQFPAHWYVRIVPPFMGAMVRFQVMKEPNGEWISVYLDCYDLLGCMGAPYWEIYPNAQGDTERVLMDETDELIAAIERALKALK